MPLIIPVFITHQGCPHRCIFCDQHAITGRSRRREDEITPDRVAAIVDEWLARSGRRPAAGVQVAFYGGSFTGLPRERQAELLGAVSPYLADGRVDSVRLSTRPDYVDSSTPLFLRDRGVGCVELGVQSMDEAVLAASGRGYGAACVEKAVGLLREAGLKIGLQMMIGLPAETTARLIRSARRLAVLKPDFVRIYPALVIKGTGLHHLYAAGRYKPLTLSRAVAKTVRLKTLFDRHAIKIVRMGLQPSAALEGRVVAGPYHPAFGELVLSRALFRSARSLLVQALKAGPRQMSINPKDVSILRGPGNCSMNRLAGLGLLHATELVCDPGQQRQTISVRPAQSRNI